MKILYDHQIFARQKVGGISRYFFELYEAGRKNCTSAVSVKYHENSYLERYFPTSNVSDQNAYLIGDVSFPGRGLLNNTLKKIFKDRSPITVNTELTIETINKGSFDIFHPTYYDDYFLKYIGNKPYVLTIYDMIHEIYPEFFPGDQTSQLKKFLFENATKIISISDTTKSDIIQIYKCRENDISVVPLASSLNGEIVEENDFLLPFDYILFVGDRNTYKNFLFILQALGPILQENRLLKLICTGKQFSKNEKTLIQNIGLLDRVLQIEATDIQMIHLYKNAKLFIFPSLYEGFGLPVLESFSCNCPVACSNSGSLPEIAKDAALYFDPKSIIGIQNVVNTLLSKETIRQQLISNGKKRLKKYSWPVTVEKTYEVYKSAI